MRKTMLSIATIFVLISCVYAQPLQSSDERVRTSTVVPDLHNPANGWKIVPEREELLYQNKDLTVKLRAEYYENNKDDMAAFLWVKDAKKNREELAMLYGTPDVARGAIKFGGAWYVSKVLYFDKGKGNSKGSVSWEVVYDAKEADKLVKAKLTLETLEGSKEVIIDLQ